MLPRPMPLNSPNHCLHLYHPQSLQPHEHTISIPILYPYISIRRARAERESRRQALQERAKRGLLSEEEKVILAKEEAESAMEKKNDCVII